jgi:ABC-type transporter Mla maintaining outer membrane lipid asymmetry permease subunit MlaE
MSAGAAGAALISETLRPWLLVFSAVSLVFAFIQTYVRRRCEFRQRRLRTALLWFSAVIVVGMAAAPRVMSGLLIGRLPSFHASGQLRTFDARDFEIEFREARDSARLVVLLSPT